jgi:Mrp family chromosome partitioning ATPase
MQTTVTPIFGDGALAQPPARRAHVIAITGGKGGVGKTSVSANLAVSLALRGKRVCIFDANPRLIGQLVSLKIDRASVSTLYGELVLAGVEA